MEHSYLNAGELAFVLDTLDDFRERVLRLKARAANPIDLHNAETSLAALASAGEKLKNGQKDFTRDEAKNIYSALTNRRRFINAMLDSEAMKEDKREDIQNAWRLSNSAIRSITAVLADAGIDAAKL